MLPIQEINEGNALIAELLEWPKDDYNYFSPPEKIDRTIFEYDAYPPSNMKFHKDWNWLMLGIEKWNLLATEMHYKLDKESDLDDHKGWRAWSYRRINLTTDKVKMYTRLVSHIKWCNNLY